MSTSTERLSGNLSTFKIVMMVVAAAAPLGAVVGIIPIAMAIGSGSSMPAVFVLTGVLLLCFAVGYAAMARRMSAAGGFYTYVAQGLGRPAALAAAVVAIGAYLALTLLLVASVGNFGTIVATLLIGHEIPWWVFAGVALACVAVMGVREITIAGNVLAVMLGVELLAILVLVVAIIVHRGAGAFPAQAMNPAHLFTPGSFGLGFMFALTTFIGFESAAIYSEESQDSRRSVPRATYIAVLVIAGFYALTTWVVVGAVGTGNVEAVASKKLSGLVFGLSNEFATGLLTKIMYVATLTSLFSALLALHNATSRYLFSISREGALLPVSLGRTHPKHDTPARASLTVTAVCVLVSLVFAVIGADPYLNMLTIMTGIGTLGIVVLQALAAAAIIAYFWRTARSGAGVLIGSAIGLIAFVAAAVLIVQNFKTLSGATSDWINVLPYALLGAAVIGGLRGWWLRSRRPEKYARIGTYGEFGE
ncbi:APC family permease [Amycolatopsis jejuensis]|uniref:APC family permease n=1 Tax=Amycolatopsis jejuensis TaxID=330084 RepID=UPI000A8872EC|nr:APC family permease [Amycolatopsis jejuensis]